jgi:protoheme IX farnesyltransferase
MLRQEIAAQTLELSATVVRPRMGLWAMVRAYIALTKPRIISLLVTTVPTMIVANHGMPSLRLMC